MSTFRWLPAIMLACSAWHQICSSTSSEDSFEALNAPDSPALPAQCVSPNPEPRCLPETIGTVWRWNPAQSKCVQEENICRGSSNVFGTKSSCEAVCRDNKKQPPVRRECVSSRVETRCPSTGPVWRWDAEQRSCIKFEGLCSRGSNKFDSEAYCLQVCWFGGALTTAATPSDRPSRCYENPPLDRCYQEQARWYYDVATSKCVITHACTTTPNVFDTPKECVKICKPANGAQPAPTPTTAAPTATKPRENSDVCKLQKDAGEWCSAELEDSKSTVTYRNRYYFDTRSGKCRGFYYKGCHGNANRFRTKSACRSKCEKKNSRQTKPKPERPAFCYKPAEVGNCRASIRRFYYHADSGKCRIFYYGGCDGNENNFEKKADCVKTCLAKNVVKENDASDDDDDDSDNFHQPKQAFCRLDADTTLKQCDDDETDGRRSEERRFFYNKRSGDCEVFTFYGCSEGNRNNFKSKADCEDACFKDRNVGSAVPLAILEAN